MNDRHARKPWSLTARLLHWLMAVLIVLQAGLGWYAESLARSPHRIDMMTAHKSLGITLLMLAIVRLSWRWTHSAPPPLPDSSGLELSMARWTHGLLYFFLFAIPLSGWVAASAAVFPWKFWWLFSWPRLTAPDQVVHDLASSVHAVFIWSLAALLALHIAAALKHHLINRDPILRRMWRK